MKKKVRLSSFLLSGLFIYSGCTPKITEIVPQKNETTEISSSNTSTTTPVSIPPKETIKILPTQHNYLQLSSIQGDVIQVEKKSTGFVFPQYKDKVILLEIFGQDCEYCMEEMPIINKLHNKYSNNLQVIAIQAQEPMSKEVSSRLIQQFNMNYPIIEKENALDLLIFIRETYNWLGILPYVLLIKDGVTEYSFSGETSEEELELAIKDLI